MFWVTTIIIFLTQGVMEVLMLNNPVAKEGIMHLGYPMYFFNMLVAFKVLGVIALIIPKIPAKIKEWAYAGFTFDFIAAFISMWAVDGFGAGLVSPIIGLIILGISYKSYHKIKG